ncbi:MAG: hypothetical protein WC815_17840 [Vicinamibacterales bacterium]|jgi:hypothetical protein
MRYFTLLVLVLHLSSMPSGQEPAFDLSDRDCQDEVLISSIEGARIYASCVQAGSERIMRVSVSNLANAKVGRLRSLSIGFCGPSVVGASAQSGWIAKIEGDDRHNVTWSLSDDLVESLGIPSRARVGGFVVRLKPGWKRSRSDSAWWGESNIVAHVTTHDC